MHKVASRVLFLITALLVTGCSFPRIELDYLNKLERLANEVETISQQPTVCMSEITRVEQQYGYLAPGHNTYLEKDFTAAEQARFERLVKRIEAANKKVIRKGDATC